MVTLASPETLPGPSVPLVDHAGYGAFRNLELDRVSDLELHNISLNARNGPVNAASGHHSGAPFEAVQHCLGFPLAFPHGAKHDEVEDAEDDGEQDDLHAEWAAGRVRLKQCGEHGSGEVSALACADVKKPAPPSGERAGHRTRAGYHGGKPDRLHRGASRSRRN